ncbi:FecR/PupR family sigma factor regulator [Paraburkholderia podalyriae]|uniref:FecR/PupR family sigma factor regulator n=2 Tax=Paraburkholderia TaxID=1822464 RepID=A0ABR7PWV6_9BURK|nr:FecR/PupR family sigma factor regulator [Paraburkholderia podalyriae]MBC8750759.1 FecR/PupR family sigma factor regulator [Paraburkholderia podalyriae]
MKNYRAGSRRVLAKTAASDSVRDGAIRWLLWLRTADCTSAELDAFRRWRAQSPKHARAAYVAMWVWRALGVLDDPREVACAGTWSRAQPDGGVRQCLGRDCRASGCTCRTTRPSACSRRGG